MKIQSGSLDRILSIYSDAPATDAVGQPSQGWAPAFTIRGQMIPVREFDRDVVQSIGRETISMRRYLVRWRDDLTTDCAAVVDGKSFAIMGTEEQGRRDGLVLTLTELVGAPIQ